MKNFYFNLTCLMLTQINLCALTFFFNNGEQWEVANPIKGKNTDPLPSIVNSRFALINYTEGTTKRIAYCNGHEVIISRKFNEVVGMVWADPAEIAEAQTLIQQGDLSGGLNLLDNTLRFIEPWAKTPGSWWLKANLLKLSGLERLQDSKKLERVLNELTKYDDGKDPILNRRMNLARLTLLNCQGEAKVALKNAEELIPKLDTPEDINRVYFCQGQAHLLLKNYESALNSFLRICVFQGSHSEQYPQVLLGIAHSLHQLESPVVADQKIRASYLFYLQRIISECPLSSEATLARELLNQEFNLTKSTPKT